ncbi:hypothetical protein ACE8FZ_29310, partial [Peribacillus frigoritolerans]|uniref:hypothetical protein n=1 Tax=Peribacillus frigoritolerans TaxID=450367 RepID=UPI0035CEBA8D
FFEFVYKRRFRNISGFTLHVFSPVLLNGWKKCATLLPSNWLAEAPERFTLRRLGRQSAERERFSEIKLDIYLERNV